MGNRFLLFVTASAISVAAALPSARAADILKAPAIAAVPPAYANWTGLWVAGMADYTWLGANSEYTPNDNFSSGPTITFAHTLGLPLTYGLNGGAIGATGQVGAAVEWNQWIVGLETEWNYTGASVGSNGAASLDTLLCGTSGCPSPWGGNQIGLTTTATLRQYGATTLDIGYHPIKAVPLAIIGKAGVAYGQFTVASSLGITGPVINAIGGPFAAQNTNTQTNFGPVVGVDLEYMLSRSWIAKLSFEHVFWSPLDLTVPGFPGASVHTSYETNSLRLGVKYLWNPAASLL